MKRLFLVIVLWFWMTLLAVGLLLAGVFMHNGMWTRTMGLHLHDIFLISIAGAISFYFISSYLTKPLHSLAAAASNIAEGRLETRVDPKIKQRRDEIADLAKNFDRMAERIDALVSGQRRLLGDVSHELRSPLARLIVALGLVKQGGEDVPENLKRIELEAQRLDVLIGQLLALTRIDSGVDRGSPGRFDLTTLVQEIANDGDFEARARNRRVVVTHADACSISGFEEVMRSAIENVVRNAIRHTADDSAVEVSVRVQEPRIAIQIRDHGRGVPEDMLAEIFLPFRRVAAGDSDGAGLGLAIAQRAIQVHQGNIVARNAPGGGLMVEIDLPTS